MKSGEKIKVAYRIQLTTGVITLLTGLFLSTLSLYYGLDKKRIDFVLCVLIVAALVTIVTSVKELIILRKDYGTYKNGNYLEIKGRVIGFKENRDPDSGVQINCMPIIQIDDNSEICLIVDTYLDLNGTYRFKYLKHSRLAEIVESEKG